MKRTASTPAARRAAAKKNIDISIIQGTGNGGFVQLCDVLNANPVDAGYSRATFLAKSVAEYMGINIADVTAAGDIVRKADVLAYNKQGADRILPHNGMRSTIAGKMLESMQTAPQYTMMMEVDCFGLKAFFRDYLARCLEDTGIKPTFSDLFIKACAVSLRKNPLINSSFMEDHVLLKGNVNIGLAVSLGEKGLIVPNIKNVHLLSLEQITIKRDDLVRRAQEGRLQPDEYADGTFTISNFGRSPVQFFTPIINQPESAVLGISNMTDKVVPIEDGMGVRPMLGMSLTVDHRNIDGTTGEQFMRDVKEILENPEMLDERK